MGRGAVLASQLSPFLQLFYLAHDILYATKSLHD